MLGLRIEVKNGALDFSDIDVLAFLVGIDPVAGRHEEAGKLHTRSSLTVDEGGAQVLAIDEKGLPFAIDAGCTSPSHEAVFEQAQVVENREFILCPVAVGIANICARIGDHALLLDAL